ncbi:MAG TPA: DUF4136 domain-containing protein [Myxococcales bacterium]|jgi:hypothetical protein
MRTKSALAVALLGLLLSACSTMKVSSTTAPGAAQKIQRFHTYAWLPEPENQATRRDPFLEQQVMHAVDRELATKGYQRVDTSAHPDFDLGWIATTKDMTREEDTYGLYGFGWGPYGGAFGTPEATVHYTEGTLILDAVDPTSKQIVWRGQAQADLGSNPTGSDAEKKVNDAAHKMLAQFPPKP